MDNTKYGLRTRKITRLGALKRERSTWDKRARDISEYLLPFSGRFFTGDRNRGDKNFNSILDSHATWALGVLAAGLMAGMTSPARPWFRLTTPDPQLAEHAPVKEWLNQVTLLMRDIFARSNTYRSLHSVYEELGSFSTAVDIVEDNFEKVIWHHPLTWGDFYLTVNQFGRPDGLYREFEMTVAQVVEKFGYNEFTNQVDWTNISYNVKNLWDNGKAYDNWIPLLHVIEPRAIAEREYGRRDNKNKPWRSCYIEMGTNDEKLLRDSGYDDFPVLAARWHTRGSDIYGHGPAFNALGDIKQLQHEQMRKGQGIDMMTNPPLALPGELKSSGVNRLPGGTNFFTGAGAQLKGHALFDISINLQHLLSDIQDVRARISRNFFTDLFLMITTDTRAQPPTAREVAERHEEKLLMLGPVLERLHDELLSRLIDLTFFKIVQNRMLPPPPPELAEQDLKVEFVSVLAQAQRAVGLGSVDRLIGTVGLIAQGSGRQDVWDKVDLDQVVDKYSDMLAVDPSLIVADDQVAIIRRERVEQQAQAQQAAQIEQMAGAAQKLGTVKTDEKNAASDIMSQFSSL